MLTKYNVELFVDMRGCGPALFRTLAEGLSHYVLSNMVCYATVK